jgi:hypothetical protein
MVANSDVAVCLAAVRPDLMARCDQLEQQLSQADQQRRRLLIDHLVSQVRAWLSRNQPSP